MDFISGLFDRDRWPVAILVVGCVFLFLSTFDVGLNPYSVTTKASTSFIPLTIGLVLTGFGLLMIALVTFDALPSGAIGRPSLPMKLGSLQLDVQFGSIEEFRKKGVVALPVNEFFDTDCFNDRRSSAGAYLCEHFPNALEELREKVSDALAAFNSERVEKHEGESDESYGVGRVAYVQDFAGTKESLAFVSVTEQRIGKGIYAQEEFIISAVRALSECAARNRFQKLVVPQLGSGHGQLGGRMALLVMFLAFASVSKNSHLRQVTIVIYRPKDAEPQVTEAEVQKVAEITKYLIPV